VGGPNRRPYLRLPGVGPSLVDPDENAGQSAMRCNGAGLAFRPAIQAMGPHVAPLGMVNSRGCCAACSRLLWAV
jgi:hypothetical protein